MADQDEDEWAQFYDSAIEREDVSSAQTGTRQGGAGPKGGKSSAPLTHPRRGVGPLAFSVVVSFYLGLVVFGLLASVRVHSRAFSDVSEMMVLFGAGIISALAGIIWALIYVAKYRTALSWAALLTALLLPVGTVVLAGGLGLRVLGAHVGEDAVRFAADAGFWGRLLDSLLEYLR